MSEGEATTGSCRTLRLVLGDQLNAAHPWFRETDDEVLYLLAELRQEATYARHHVQKIAAFFAAMERFAQTLREAGHRVLHLDLDDTADFEDLPALLSHLCAKTGAKRFEYQRPDEYRLLCQLESFCDGLEIGSAPARSHHFLVPFEALDDYFPADRQQRMETFYRRVRRETGWLMDDDGKPEGGQWNYDVENRKALPKEASPPPPLLFENDVSDLLERIGRHDIPVIGRIDDDRLGWPVDREQSLALLEHFVTELLACFGDYQDALTDRGWSLFHSRLSFSMNAKLLSPREVVEAVLEAWRERPDELPLSSVEGFVRQVIGWREFVRGIYWTRMPDYATLNELGHERGLPSFYWTGETRMACMAQAIGQSLDHAYAHHIQRLMVTGNFALLAGVHPDEVDAWYLGIYVDALQWVELPNTRGMSQFADGGVLASKPYAASANYLNKMGDHCGGCAYDPKQRHGEGACPFNALYWHFMDRHRERFERNPRIGMIYRSWDRMDSERRDAIREHAERLLENLDAC
ncbi:MAG: cryptochrome/photolyase family protein [Gammaproteobacteria bacterium]